MAGPPTHVATSHTWAGWADSGACMQNVPGNSKADYKNVLVMSTDYVEIILWVYWVK